MRKYDILAYKGDSLLSRLIRCITGSKYSHVGIVLDEYHIAEINYDFKFKIRHMTYKKNTYDLYRCQDEIFETLDTVQMDLAIHTYLGASYDYGEILRALGIAAKDTCNKLICSSAVHKIYLSGGIDLVACDWVITPKDICDSIYLQKVEKKE